MCDEIFNSSFINYQPGQLIDFVLGHAPLCMQLQPTNELTLENIYTYLDFDKSFIY